VRFDHVLNLLVYSPPRVGEDSPYFVIRSWTIASVR
jgi:hypothetical protein